MNTGVRPNSVTLLSLLLACNHSGLGDKGYTYFNKARVEDPGLSIMPVWLIYCHAQGRLEEAERFLQELPFVPGIGFWKALLWGCRIHSNMELGELAARKILALDPEDVSSYVMLSNAHSAAGRWHSVSMIRKEEFRVAVGLKSEASFISLLQGTETMNNTIRFIRSWDFCLPTFEFEGEIVILWVKRVENFYQFNFHSLLNTFK